VAALVQHLGTGRRKRAVARVFLRSGKGVITINGRTFENYFPSEASRAIVRQPLLATETADKFDILITAAGEGPRAKPERRSWVLPGLCWNSTWNCAAS
jgi:small subunit ribosomal protein S9